MKEREHRPLCVNDPEHDGSTKPARVTGRNVGEVMPPIDITALLESIGTPRVLDEYGSGGLIFAQGDPGVDVRYIQAGGVKLTIASKDGHERVIGLLRPGDFFGESCLAGQPVRIAGATALLPSTILRLEKQMLLRVLREQRGMSDRFIAHVLARNIRIQEDLLDHLMGPVVPPPARCPPSRRKRWRKWWAPPARA